MAKYAAVNAEHQERYNKLFEDCQVFWAFSNEQLKAGIEALKLKKGEKVSPIDGGGFLPKKNVDKLIAGLKEIKAWKKQAMQEVDATEAILYELNNHECFYSDDIENAMSILSSMGYTREQVAKVHRRYQTQAREIEHANEGALTR